MSTTGTPINGGIGSTLTSLDSAGNELQGPIAVLWVRSSLCFALWRLELESAARSSGETSIYDFKTMSFPLCTCSAATLPVDGVIPLSSLLAAEREAFFL